MTPTIGRVLGCSAHLALTAVTTANAAMAGYLGVMSVAGSPRARDRGSPSTNRTRFVILVPAHNEEAVIADALHAFQGLDYDRSLFEVHVVADNCTDATARIVRAHGWNAHERHAPADPGKGPALNWLFERVDANGPDFDVAVIVDADSIVDRNFLSELDRAFSSGVVAAQGFYSVRDPDRSPAASLRFAALACRHYLRPLGRSRLGLSAGLYGNGMAFERSILRRRRWSGHLVEDAEFQLELLLAEGIRVSFVPGASLQAEMPMTFDAATSQNTRWERGRLELVRRYVPALVRRAGHGPLSRRAAYADAVVDLLVPPLSVLVTLQMAGLGGNVASSVLGSRGARRRTYVDLLALATVALHVIAGLRSVKAPGRVYATLLEVPRFMVWKVSLWLKALGSGDVVWERTRRNAEA